ncbi:MAG: squalene/phytoene synthase family protein [Planctomycetes bacterium]|nr:squalene/phytoene synthase family protein [Planctomycetota bacterium]
MPVPRAERSSAAFCRRMLPKVSRTFALGIEVLPDGLRDAVRTAYLLCRIADTIEDDADLAGTEKRRRLAMFVRLLRNRRAGRRAADAFAAACVGTASVVPDEAVLLAGAAEVFEELRRLPSEVQGILERRVGELAEGMGEYSARERGRLVASIRTVEDLDRYCYYVAGTVGLALTDLFRAYVRGLDAARHRQLEARAVGFGRGLQMVNILKDVTKDFARRWVYLPGALLESHGIDPKRMRPAQVGAAGVRALDALVVRALGYLDEAEEYLRLLPHGARRVRLFCAWPLFFALKTLSRVRGNSAVFSSVESGDGPVKISRADVAAIVRSVRERVRSNRALHEMYLSLRNEAAPLPVQV